MPIRQQMPWSAALPRDSPGQPVRQSWLVPAFLKKSIEPPNSGPQTPLHENYLRRIVIITNPQPDPYF